MSWLLVAWAAGNVIQVSPTNPEEISVAVYGDVRRGQDQHRQFADAILSESPDLTLMTGDLVQRNTPSEWALFDKATKALREKIPYFPSVGNHDVSGLLNESEFDRFFPQGRWYEVKAGRLVVLVVDTTQGMSQASHQGQWLRSRLKALSQEPDTWVIASHHHPVYSTGPHGPYGAAVRDLKPLYEEFGVDVVFQGHDHLYERATLNGIHYIVTGGGGAPLYHSKVEQPPTTHFRASVHHRIRMKVTRQNLHLEVVGLDGKVIDRATIQKTKKHLVPTRAQNSPWGVAAALIILLAISAGVTRLLARVKTAQRTPLDKSKSSD